MLHLLQSPRPATPNSYRDIATSRRNTRSEAALLGSMFAARKSVFVDLLKWDVPVVAGRYEIDQFDDAHATYLVLAGADGSHQASARLLPTTRPHILGSFYPQLCKNGPPSGAAIFEITRFCLDRSLRAGERRQKRDLLVRALADHAVATGIAAYTAIAAPAWCDQILAFGWRARALGDIRRIGSDRLCALRIDINRHTPSLLAKAGIGEPPTMLRIATASSDDITTVAPVVAAGFSG